MVRVIRKKMGFFFFFEFYINSCTVVLELATQVCLFAFLKYKAKTLLSK